MKDEKQVTGEEVTSLVAIIEIALLLDTVIRMVQEIKYLSDILVYCVIFKYNIVSKFDL